MAKGTRSQDLVERGRVLLREVWVESERPAAGVLAAAELEIVDDLVNSSTKSYRYVLPTQLLAKLANPSLDCRSLQEGATSAGAFDARSFCTDVLIPFDREHHSVLGGSGDPYVNNPLRVSRIGAEHLDAQKNKGDYRKLIRLLDLAQENPNKVRPLLVAAMSSIRRRLTRTKIEYGVPNRVSLEWAERIIREFLAEPSGGLRLQVVSVGLFRTTGKAFHRFDSVDARKVNTADRASGNVADLECLSGEKPVLAVEVKDRQLTLRDVEEKLPGVRGREVRELMFLAAGGVAQADREELAALVRREFAAGHNVYCLEFWPFLSYSLALLGEIGRRRMMVEIGSALDEFADLPHRERWRDLLLSSQIAQGSSGVGT